MLVGNTPERAEPQKPSQGGMALTPVAVMRQKFMVSPCDIRLTCLRPPYHTNKKCQETGVGLGSFFREILWFTVLAARPVGETGDRLTTAAST